MVVATELWKESARCNNATLKSGAAAIAVMAQNEPFCFPRCVVQIPRLVMPGVQFEPPGFVPIKVFDKPGCCSVCHGQKLVDNPLAPMCYMCSRDIKAQGLKQGSYVEPGLPRKHGRPNLTGLRPYGYVFPRRPMVMTAPSLEAEMQAAVYRQCSQVPPQDKSSWDELEEFVGLKAGVHTPLWGTSPRYSSFTESFTPAGKRLTREEWNSHFPEARRKAHDMAYKAYWFAPADKAIYKKWCTIAMFVKREKLDKCGEWYAPRVISSFDPKVTAFTGPCITAVQNWLHSWWNGKNVPVLFAAGSTIERMSEAFDHQHASGRKCFTVDMSIFDSTVGKRCHDFGMKLYRKIGFEMDPHFLDLRAVQGGTLKGYGVSGCRFMAPDSMKSGQADTCVLNSIINVICHLYAIAKSNNIVDVDGKLCMRRTLDKTFMMVMGDDNLGFVDGDLDLKGVPGILYRLGLIPKFNEEKDPEQAVFLNMLPYPVGGGKHRFAPKLGRLMARLGWATSFQKDIRAFMCGIGRGFETSCQHVPVLRALVQRLVRLGRRVNGVSHDRGLHLTERFRRQHLGFTHSIVDAGSSGTEPTTETFTFMSTRYGWSDEDIRRLEADIGSWPDPPALVGDCLLEEAIFLDCSG